ncbi:IucA/IucC family protein [Streptomyces sp. CBMA123]|uniref:IucA/IucC family protein n=1 Tax=Streptomyces sp. CBMA123 TaxID=1896313 RepID=UPI001661AEA6|nr:IucA/IucC family siderophore biosynthesis protein [Streptomyces sp. CBMA123]MBD0689829.1 iron transporter [Streptomyces sp. CBMA123]
MPDGATERKLAEELGGIRPDLVDAYLAALPGARAAVLARLWRGLVHEPLPWVEKRVPTRDGISLLLADGRLLHGPASDPWATGTTVAHLELDGRRFDRPARLLTELGVPGGRRFADELDHSVASMALSRTAPRPGGPPASPWGWEQRSPDGHPYHPACRSRPGFSAAEQLAYAPEHRPVVALRLAPVADAMVRGRWPAELRDGGLALIPVHPWQAEHTLAGRPLRPGPNAHPLLSLRTLDLGGNLGGNLGGSLGGNLHVKTALSVQLTSAVRDISAYSVEHALTTSELVERAAERLDGRLHIARTLAAAGNGTPDLAAMLRQSPYAYAEAGEQVVPVAELPGYFAPLPPDERRERIAEFARLAVTVCLDLLDLGVALEAHGQNLLAVLDRRGRARRLVYRDLADIRISPTRVARHGLRPPSTGRLLDDDPARLRRKVLGCLLTGALGPLAGSAPALGTVLRAATQDLPAGPDLHALLNHPLPAKALTLMRLAPGADHWAQLPNPALHC